MHFVPKLFFHKVDTINGLVTVLTNPIVTTTFTTKEHVDQIMDAVVHLNVVITFLHLAFGVAVMLNTKNAVGQVQKLVVQMVIQCVVPHSVAVLEQLVVEELAVVEMLL